MKWKETSESEQYYKAPLILIPLTTDKKRRGLSVNHIFEVTYSGEEIESSLSLAEKVKQDFGMELPEINEDIEPEEYLKKVQDVIASQEGWSVEREMLISFFSFAKIRMYKDLDLSLWPDITEENRPAVFGVLGGNGTPSGANVLNLGEETNLDDLKEADSLPVVVDADSSQLNLDYAAS